MRARKVLWKKTQINWNFFENEFGRRMRLKFLKAICMKQKRRLCFLQLEKIRNFLSIQLRWLRTTGK
jgi:hypothetical protein